ncbi:MAG: rubrerythrin family protein [Oscillospiraceae bacterium]|nr:rubrerythrin family protein [Oscillospiraceae bacterium]
MMELKGSRTEQNLMAAFAGESQARSKYDYFASAAKKEGYEQISAFFSATANNEKEHGKIWFKLLNGIGNTAENLKSGASGEHYEHTDMYPTFAKVAKEEGFDHIALLFERVAKIEAEHEARYLKLLENVSGNKVFVKDSAVTWECRNCGHEHHGADAPDVCSTCLHPKAYFEVKIPNY